MSERVLVDSRRSWPEVIRPRALAAFAVLWNIPATLIFIWALQDVDQSQMFERFCVLQAFLLGLALVAVASSSWLQRLLLHPQADLVVIRKRLYVGGFFWTLAAVAAFMFLSV